MKPLRQAVVAIITNENREVLIGNSPRDGGFKFPQGGLEQGEAPHDGLIREIKEELGVHISTEDIVNSFNETAIYTFPQYLIDQRPFRGQELYVFQIQYHAKMNFIPQDDEFDLMLWKAPLEIIQMDLSFRKEAYVKALYMCGLIQQL